MAKQITGAKLYLAGGHQLMVAASAVPELEELLERREDVVQKITILPGNELLIHWRQVVAMQIFWAGK